MTACVKNHSKRVALAISASLVGALSLGAAAPAVAFANEGISPLVLDDNYVDQTAPVYEAPTPSSTTTARARGAFRRRSSSITTSMTSSSAMTPSSWTETSTTITSRLMIGRV